MSSVDSRGRNKTLAIAVDLENAYKGVQFKLLVDLNSNGISRVLTLAVEEFVYKTTSDISTAVTVMAHPQQQSSWTINASSLLLWRSHKTHKQSQIPGVQLGQNADVQDAGRDRTVHAEKAPNNFVCTCCIRM